MAKHIRNVWEELLEVGRRMLKALDEFYAPEARPPRTPARAPVPAGKRRAEYGRE